MNDNDRTVTRTLSAILLIFGAGVLVFAGVGAWLLGPDRLMTLALVMTGAVSCTVVLLGTAAVIRAYRKNDAPPVIERHYMRDGTRTIERHFEGRELVPPEVKLLQLPSPNEAATYPELLRASYAAGARRAYEEQPATGSADTWQGEILS